VTTSGATSPTTVTALVDGIATMNWPQLTDAVAHCQACAMCFGRRAPVLAAPVELAPCEWLVVGDPPDEAQERLALPFVEDAGVLLDNMLRAVGVQRFVPDTAADAMPGKRSESESTQPASRAYLTHVLKCRPALMRAPDATELATCANYLRREIALTQPKVILAMGRFAMQVLLSETPPESAKLPLGKLRGQVWQFAGVPVVVTYPPSYLLRSGQDKGKAWADLCLALDVAQGRIATLD
jgi:DNA polymerase